MPALKDLWTVSCSECSGDLYEGTREEIEEWNKKTFDGTIVEWMEDERIAATMCDWCEYIYHL